MAHTAADELMLAVFNTLNEAQARWYVAREAVARGRGGLTLLHELTGMSRPTILKGMRELRQRTPLQAPERIRRPGGGRGGDWRRPTRRSRGRWPGSWRRAQRAIP